MTQDSQDDYYARREIRQRALAEKAEAPEIRKIHLDLAEGYARRATFSTPTRLRLMPAY